MDKVSIDLKDAKFKITERSRGRMKIQIKLSKEEAEGFKNFCKLKPPELDEDTFYRQIFLSGCNVMTQQIMDLVKAHQAAEANKTEEEKKDEQTEEQLQDQ
jgi:hypothetical protein